MADGENISNSYETKDTNEAMVLDQFETLETSDLCPIPACGTQASDRMVKSFSYYIN
jgi:hypothetical protein